MHANHVTERTNVSSQYVEEEGLNGNWRETELAYAMLPLLRMSLHHTIGLWSVAAPAIELKQTFYQE